MIRTDPADRQGSWRPHQPTSANSGCLPSSEASKLTISLGRSTFPKAGCPPCELISGFGDQHRGGALRGDRSDLLGCGCQVDRNRDAPGVQRRRVGDDVLDAVGRHNGNAIAGRNALGDQPRSYLAAWFRGIVARSRSVAARPGPDDRSRRGGHRTLRSVGEHRA